MGMTERQQGFLEQYREVKAPLHYSVVAEKLRISNISAYEMLRLLKQKGMVASRVGEPCPHRDHRFALCLSGAGFYRHSCRASNSGGKERS